MTVKNMNESQSPTNTSTVWDRGSIRERVSDWNRTQL
jgi:hypothetical protein